MCIRDRLLFISAQPVLGQLLQPDNRCFLEDGGSTLTFFIKEDLPVGQHIGRLNIQGRVGRDIDLTLEDVNGLYDQLPVELEGMLSVPILNVSSNVGMLPPILDPSKVGASGLNVRKGSRNSLRT